MPKQAPKADAKPSLSLEKAKEMIKQDLKLEAKPEVKQINQMVKSTSKLSTQADKPVIKSTKSASVTLPKTGDRNSAIAFSGLSLILASLGLVVTRRKAN